MPEVSGEHIKAYEIVVTRALLEKWGKSSEDAKQRAERALHIALEADMLLTPEQKLGVARNIKSFLELNRERLVEEFGSYWPEQFDALIAEIIESKGESGVSFVDLHERTLGALSEKAPLAVNPEMLTGTEMLIAQFKADIFSILKAAIPDKKELEGLRKEKRISDAFDDLTDELRGKASFEAIMQAMLDLLMEELSMEGAAILYNVPLKKHVEFGDDKFPQGEIGEERTVTKGGVDLNRVRTELSQHKNEEPAFVGVDVDENPKTYCVMPVHLRNVQLGTLVLMADGDRKSVEAKHKDMVRFVESRVDSLIDIGMKNLIKRRLREQINRICKPPTLSKFANAFKNSLALLRNFVGADIEFVWRDKITAYGFRVTENEVIDLLDDDLISVLDEEGEIEGGTVIRLYDDRRPLFVDDDDPEEEEPLCVGVLRLDKPGTMVDEEETELMETAAEILEKGVMERKGQFEAFSMGQGTNVAEGVVDGTIEWKGKHPCVSIMADIQSSTAFCEAVGEDAYARLLNQFYKNLPKLELVPNHRLTIDKEMGDGVLLESTPLEKEGEEYGYYLAVALHNIKKIREAWEKAMDTEKGLPWRPQLCIGLQSSPEAIRGFFGPKPTKRRVGRLDWTSVGKAVNESSRIESAVKFAQVYISKQAYEVYREFVERAKREDKWDGSLEEFFQVGLCVNVFGKGVSDPIDTVEVLSEEDLSAMREKQSRVFAEAKGVDNEYTFRSALQIPNGHYDIDYHVPDTTKGSRKVVLKSDKETLTALVPETEFRQITEYVPIDVHQQILTGELPDKTVRVTDTKVIVVYYECVEIRQRNIIKALLEQSLRQKRGLTIDIEDLPSGEYEIDRYTQAEGSHIFEVRRFGHAFKVFVPAKKLEGNPSKYGVLRYRSLTFTCIPEEEPEWAYMK